MHSLCSFRVALAARQHSCPDWMLQLADGVVLQLSDAFAGDLEHSSYLFERMGVAVGKTETELHDLAFSVRERLEDPIDALATSTGSWARLASTSSPI